jgi:hypothetical protein
MNVENVADLGKLRAVSRLRHDDERLSQLIVTMLRDYLPVGRIICASEALAFDAYRLVAGLRFRREDTPVAEAVPMFAAAA